MGNKQFTDNRHLQIVADIIGEELGLHYPDNRLNELLRGFERTSELFQGKLSVANLIEEIIRAKSVPEHLYTQLSSALTINETYFFRETPAINLFKTLIIKEIENSNGNYKIWSAGCSSGEEPFTLAILLKEMLPPHIANSVKIIATDLSDKALNKAKEGVYTQWSFRETPNNIREKYFKAIDGKWLICDDIKKMVSFFNLNLITAKYPSSSKGIQEVNLIFCRNVLMYFSYPNITLVANKLYNSLSKGGWLVTSQVELNDLLFSKFAKVNIESGFFYRREELAPVVEPTLFNDSTTTKRVPKIEPIKIDSLSRSRKRADKNSQVVDLKPKTPVVESELETAKELANKGKHNKALDILEKLSNTDNLNIDFFYLYATILSEKGELEKAVDYYKKCIYLNPAHILANYMLANIYVELGNKKLSIKYYRTALEQVSRMDATQEVSDSGGMSAARIIEMLEDNLKEK